MGRQIMYRYPGSNRLMTLREAFLGVHPHAVIIVEEVTYGELQSNNLAGNAGANPVQESQVLGIHGSSGQASL